MGIDWDTKIPVGLIVGMVGQGLVLFFAVTVWGALIDSRVQNIEAAVREYAPTMSRLAVLESSIGLQIETLDNRLDRNEDRLEHLERLRGIFDTERDSR